MADEEVSVTRQTLVELSLIILLGMFGVLLEGGRLDVEQIREEFAAADNGILFRGTRGVDVHGRRVDTVATSGVVEVAFWLRSEGVLEQLAKWKQVDEALAGDAELMLVGYCDGRECVERARAVQLSSRLVVVAYSEVLNAQAVAIADGDGGRALRLGHRDGTERPTPIEWRAVDKSAAEIASEIYQ